MEERLGTAEDLAELPAVVIGFPGFPAPQGSWPAAEAAGLVNVGGRWMTPEALEKMRAWKRKQQEEREQPEAHSGDS